MFLTLYSLLEQPEVWCARHEWADEEFSVVTLCGLGKTRHVLLFPSLEERCVVL